MAGYYEAVSRGKVYLAANQAAVTFGTTLTATAVTFTLYNPLGSPVDLVLLQCSATVVTCTTAGSLVYSGSANPHAAEPSSLTELTVRNARLGGSAGIGKAFSAATLPATPVVVRPFASCITAVGVGLITDYVDGAIVLRPNTAVTIQGVTVVGTGLFGMTWAEVPLTAA